MTFLLRVEAMNIDAFINDTSDLSTARGGGLLLLDAITAAASALPAGAETVSQGASVGLFSFDAADLTGARAVATRVRTALTNEPFAHATFAIVLVKQNYGFRRSVESGKALARWHQMGAPSVAFPAAGAIDAVCEFDRLRPATATEREGADLKPISSSVSVRRHFGREQKQHFYRRTAQALQTKLGAGTTGWNGADHLLGNLNQLPEFAADFHELTFDDGKNRLAGKMAVFYADGNGFGRIQADRCDKIPIQQAFDRDLRRQREIFLADLLGRAMQDPGFLTQEGKLRIETPLWGGDELLLVVPAWRGWAVMLWFFDHAMKWSITLPPPATGVVPGVTGLKHGAGLVFCSHKAPIARVRRLAYELAEVSKNAGRDRDLVACEVLESFDHTGDDLAEYRARLWEGVASRDRVLTPAAAKALEDANREVVPDLPRRLAHRIVRSFRGRSTEDVSGPMRAWRGGLSAEAASAWARLETAIPDERARWLHLIDLLDYLPEA